MRRFLIIGTTVSLVARAASKVKKEYKQTPKGAGAAALPLPAFDPKEMTALGANRPPWDPGLKSKGPNQMFQDLYANQPGTYLIERSLVVPGMGRYEITALMMGVQGRIVIEAGGWKPDPVAVRRKSWDRSALGTLEVKEGPNGLALNMEADSPLELASVKLARPDMRARDRAQTRVERPRPGWCRDAGCGLRFQWCNGATPLKDDKVYAISLVPADGTVRIRSLNKSRGPITGVRLLGNRRAIQWKQTPTALELDLTGVETSENGYAIGVTIE